MSVTWKLALSYALRHPTRIALTSLAMIASACIVVWVVSGYDALVSQFDEQAAEYLGKYDFFIVPEDPEHAHLDTELVAALQKDPAVAEVTPVMQVPIQKFITTNADEDTSGPRRRGDRPGPGQAGHGKRPRQTGHSNQPREQRSPTERTGEVGRPGGTGRLRFGPPKPPMLVGTDSSRPPQAIVLGTWIDPKNSESTHAVISQDVAESWNLMPGSKVRVTFDKDIETERAKEYSLEIVGILKQDASQAGSGLRMRLPSSKGSPTGIEAGPATSAIYVSTALAKQLVGDRAKVNLINIQLKPETEPKLASFRKTWETRVAKTRPLASILGVEDVKSDIEEGMLAQRSRQQAWAATGLSLLASLFIIFTTLSMGVTERVRQFAIMQAVGLTRGQVARVIAIEGIILALIGWGGGLLAGWGLLTVISRMQSGLFSNGASLGFWCIVFTGLSAFGGSLAASILPAWRAMRVDPLEAMSPQQPARPKQFWAAVLGIVGLVLIVVNPILVYAASASMSSDTLYAIYAAVGCSTMAVGFLLLTPATILIVESTIGPVIAWILGLDPRLLRSQLSSNLWRTLGTTAALTVGLGLFVAMQIWGYSMLEPFKPGPWVPDMLVAIQRGGFPDSEIETVRAIEGVKPEQCIPLAVEQSKLASDITGSEEHNSVIRQDNVIMIGLDPQVAFGGSDPLIKAQFVEGLPGEAIAKLKQGRNCIVPDHFLKATGLKLGERFSMLPPETPSKPVEYTIVGTVSLPGWHWMTKFSGLRRREGRSAAIVFANYDDVRRDFNLKQINFFLMNVDTKVGEKYLDAKRATVVKIGEALQPIAERHLGEVQPVNGQGTWPFGATMFGPSVRVSTPEEVQARIAQRASGMIWASCYLPLITLLVTSLGVVNTVMASVRARRWEFGILRSQGITRSGLFRMILAEGILIGLITCLLSLGFGIFSGWCGTGISQYVSFFGGLAPPLVIPWPQLSIGFGIALGLCLLAALWPAILTGRAEPLKLLQEGRAAM